MSPGAPTAPATLRWLQHLLFNAFMNLRNQTIELRMVGTDGMLAVAGFFAGIVPEGHPAELFAFRPAIEHDRKRVEGDFFFLFAWP
jgi:hypothetical protein